MNKRISYGMGLFEKICIKFLLKCMYQKKKRKMEERGRLG